MPAVDYRKLNKVFYAKTEKLAGILTKTTRSAILGIGRTTSDPQTPPFAILLNPTNNFAVAYTYSKTCLQEMSASAPPYKGIEPRYEVQFLACKGPDVIDLTPLMEFPAGMSPKDLEESFFLDQAEALFLAEGVTIKSTALAIDPQSDYAEAIKELLESQSPAKAPAAPVVAPAAAQNQSPSAIDKLNKVFFDFVGTLIPYTNPKNTAEAPWFFAATKDLSTAPHGVIHFDNGFLLSVAPSQANMNMMQKGHKRIDSFEIHAAVAKGADIYEITHHWATITPDPRNASADQLSEFIDTLSQLKRKQVASIDVSASPKFDLGSGLGWEFAELTRQTPTSSQLGSSSSTKSLPQLPGPTLDTYGFGDN